MESLFRQDAPDGQKRSWRGSIAVAAPMLEAAARRSETQRQLATVASARPEAELTRDLDELGQAHPLALQSLRRQAAVADVRSGVARNVQVLPDVA